MQEIQEEQEELQIQKIQGGAHDPLRDDAMMKSSWCRGCEICREGFWGFTRGGRLNP